MYIRGKISQKPISVLEIFSAFINPFYVKNNFSKLFVILCCTSATVEKLFRKIARFVVRNFITKFWRLVSPVFQGSMGRIIPWKKAWNIVYYRSLEKMYLHYAWCLKNKMRLKKIFLRLIDNGLIKPEIFFHRLIDIKNLFPLTLSATRSNN